ncbi:MAG: hypothetical protein OEZ01_18355 [Candidatus Heimdallarchaeota archaeon]|nr:hypothetical protein [Candidatus Heimdallarchaeota archaeon]MDH5647979.1 hypothetical protein [Candidatus Heimdallarchaeota archaeon]
MAESIQHNLMKLEKMITILNSALPMVIAQNQNKEGIELILQASDLVKEIEFDPSFETLGTTIRLLSAGGSSLLSTVYYQGYILDILEMLNDIYNEIQTHGIPKSTKAQEMVYAGEFLIRLVGRLTNRYKINVIFEKEYEAKAVRAFMVLNELKRVVRFLNINPDISMNSTANLENGLEIDALSQESAEELHKLAGSVLEVVNVQVFVETKPQPVFMLDPPDHPESFDRKLNTYLG